MSDNTHVALAALAHTLVQQLVIGYAGGMHRTVSALNLRANDCDSALKGVADDIEASRAWAELTSRLDNWRERLPGDADRLLPWLIGQPLDVALRASDLDQDDLVFSASGLPSGATLTPGVFIGTMISVLFLWLAPSLVLASTQQKSAWVPLVVHILPPLMM